MYMCVRGTFINDQSIITAEQVAGSKIQIIFTTYTH